jgi:uncharacterized membrane protein YcaP (DUF421 family)
MEQVSAPIFGTEHDLGWMQECARAVLIFVYGLIVLRLSGRRTFAHWSALDIIVSIVVGSNLSRALTGGVPLWGTLAATAVLVLLHLVVSMVVARNRRMSEWIEGRASVLARGGTLDERARLRHKISMSDIEEALRQHGVQAVEKTSLIVLEPSGEITVIKA